MPVRSTLAIAGIGLALSSFAAIASASARLSSARFAAIDAAKTALIPLEKDHFTASDVDAAVSGCQALDPADPLLAKLRPLCALDIQGTEEVATWAACIKVTSCASSPDGIRTTKQLEQVVRKTLAAAQAANPAVNRALSAGPCRDALRESSISLRSGRLLDGALRKFAHGLMFKDKASLDAADRGFAHAHSLDRHEPSSAQRLTAFRSACR